MSGHFRANGEFISGNPELENLQAAPEYQTSPEFSSPMSESMFAEAEQPNEKELELELFLNEIRDNEFETVTHEMLQELEANFEGYALHHGTMSGELESNNPNFESVVNGYFEASLGHLVPNIHAEFGFFCQPPLYSCSCWCRVRNF